MSHKGIARDVDQKLLKTFPASILKEHRLFPLKKEGEQVIALTDRKLPLPVLDELEMYIQSSIKLKDIKSDILDELFEENISQTADSVEDMLADMNSGQLDEYINSNLEDNVENLEELAQEAPIIRLVNKIIITAIRKRASDIHIEPFAEEIRVRYRIDGVLYDTSSPPRNLLPAIITRLKIMAQLNIAERRLPQEGRIRIKIQGRELDIRVSIIPNLYGEGVVLRILDKSSVKLELSELGLTEEMLHIYKDVINYSHGIVLVTGPTGSGKTTTLYATLNYLNSSEKKILTIEDPVEYQLEGIIQVPVKPEISFNFAAGLRSFLRHDPDIIMVGEIRDSETAQIAVQAALTGHLVLATLHTNDAPGAISRMLDMGVESYLLASILKGILAQRLVRKICPNCKESFQVRDCFERSRINDFKKGIKLENLYQGIGCKECNQIGYKGRTGIYELIPVGREISTMISNQIDLNQIRRSIREKGIENLKTDGLRKVKKGLTSLEEVLRVTKI